MQVGWCAAACSARPLSPSLFTCRLLCVDTGDPVSNPGSVTKRCCQPGQALTCRSLSFLLCKMGFKRPPTFKGCLEAHVPQPTQESPGVHKIPNPAFCPQTFSDFLACAGHRARCWEISRKPNTRSLLFTRPCGVYVLVGEADMNPIITRRNI